MYMTTGEAARVCGVAVQTIIRWIDRGVLCGLRIPGSRARRVRIEDLISFMHHYHLPLDRLCAFLREGDLLSESVLERLADHGITIQAKVGRLRVLLVDDDQAILSMLGDLFEKDGRFEVATAQSGFEAGTRFAEFRPKVVVLDYRLPDINGDRVCETIRSHPVLKNTGIIMVSGSVDPDDIRHLRAAGAHDFLRKPFVFRELLAAIEKIAGSLRQSAGNKAFSRGERIQCSATDTW